MTLAEKAERFEREIAERFLSPEGTLQYRQDAAKSAFGYANVSDAAAWTGALCGAEALRFSVTRSEEARSACLRALRGLDFLQQVTGIPGLFARNAVPRDAGVEEGSSKWFDGSPPLDRFRWRGDVSKDQYSGVLFGYSMAFYALGQDEEALSLIRRGASGIADHLIANGYRIVDRDGAVTTYGDLRIRYAGIVPIGLHALIDLLAVRLAGLACEDPRYDEALSDLVADGAAGIAYWTKFQLFGVTNHVNDNMQYLVNTPLAWLEPAPEIRRAILRALERTFRYVRHEGNSFFTLATASVMPVDPAAIQEAKLTLRLFPSEKISMDIDLRGRKEFETAWLDNRQGQEMSRYALPISYRSPTAFAWKDDPYALLSHGGREGEARLAGTDYLVAYWLGRATGFVADVD